MAYVTEQQLVTRATRLMERTNDVKRDTIKPLVKNRNYAGGITNENGIIWYERTQAYVSDVICPIRGHRYAHYPYMGEIWMQCKDERQNKDWWFCFGICPDGTLRIWAN